MPRARANGVELEYESFGDAASQSVLLIAGLGSQMISWDEEFCERLAAAGPFHVIRFDNRDCGLSTKFDERGVPDVIQVLTGHEKPAYTLHDMAADAAALMDSLGIQKAHVVGASMGGFIAQLLAIEYPKKVLSLTSIMSGPGSRAENMPATPEATEVLLKRSPADREGLIEHGIWVNKVLQGPTYFDEAESRWRRTRAVDRSVSTEGTARQLGASWAALGRTEALGKVSVPALVIHGEIDPLIPVENGRRTAAAIPGARLLTFPQMGHHLPRPLWPEIVEAIVANASLATASSYDV
jgi:pimeloyl-ACP methyl ester carboxylesterase